MPGTKLVSMAKKAPMSNRPSGERKGPRFPLKNKGTMDHRGKGSTKNVGKGQGGKKLVCEELKRAKTAFKERGGICSEKGLEGKEDPRQRKEGVSVVRKPPKQGTGGGPRPKRKGLWGTVGGEKTLQKKRRPQKMKPEKKKIQRKKQHNKNSYLGIKKKKKSSSFPKKKLLRKGEKERELFHSGRTLKNEEAQGTT